MEEDTIYWLAIISPFALISPVLVIPAKVTVSVVSVSWPPPPPPAANEADVNKPPSKCKAPNEPVDCIEPLITLPATVNKLFTVLVPVLLSLI